MRRTTPALAMRMLLLLDTARSLTWHASIISPASSRTPRVPMKMQSSPPTPSPLTSEEVLADLSGARLNEEERVTVTYSGSAASRERRVRRTRRLPKEERWQRSVEPEGYRRMSAYCIVDSINLEDAITVLTSMASFGERVSITSYTDVAHARFTEVGGPTAVPYVRDAFLFPCMHARA